MFKVLDTWREQRKIRQTHQQLYALSDHVLSDIGLTRADIHKVGRHGQMRR